MTDNYLADLLDGADIDPRVGANAMRWTPPGERGER